MTGDRLVGRGGRILRLWDVEGRPATDSDGRPLSMLGGRLLVIWDPLRCELRDPLGRPLRDALDRTSGELEFNPEATPLDPPVAPLDSLYVSLDARLLTDSQKRPLADPKGRIFLQTGNNPQADTEGRQVFEMCGDDLDEELTTPQWLWDEDGRPLTDLDGNPLRDIFGHMLLKTDSGVIADITRYGAGVVDSRRRNPNHRLFDSTVKPLNILERLSTTSAFKDLVSERRVVFDMRGLPLTSAAGDPLYSLKGTKLVSKHKGNLIEISVSHYDPSRIRVLLSSRLLPMRLFDPQGRPVTSTVGEPLRHADGRLLVIFNENCQPAGGLDGAMIYDEFGAPLGDSAFRPDDPLSGAPILIRTSPGLYDSDGLPLTDSRGYTLLTATRQPLIQHAPPQSLYPYLDRHGRQVFCQSGLPLVRTLEQPLLGARGRPCRLFDSRRLPLTDSEGVPLKFINGGFSLTVDDIGRIIADNKGGSLFDASGVALAWPARFNPCRPVIISKKDPRAYRGNREGTQLFDSRGLPVTGAKGEPLTTADGESLILVDPKDGVLRQRDGRPVFDLTGRPQRGSIYNLGAAGDGTTVKRKVDILQLFDIEQSPIYDDEKGFSESEGQPLVVFNAEGKISSDSKGRDIFDSRGIPLTCVSGSWRGPKGQPIRLFDNSGRPLTDTEGRPLTDAIGHSLVREDQIGRPLFSADGQPARDARGRTYADVGFCPMEGPAGGSLMRDTDDEPLRVFDARGRPLTDEFGATLAAADGTPLLEGPLRRLRTKGGGRAFDNRGVPLGCAPGEILTSPGGMPLRLFSRSGTPLTCPRGRPLRFANDLPVLVFDMLGRPLQDAEGGPVCDARGIGLGSLECKPDIGPSGTSTITGLRLPDGQPLRLFDADGRPLTAPDGRPLPRADGTTLRLCPRGNPIAAPDGGPLFDQYGSRVQSTNKL